MALGAESGRVLRSVVSESLGVTAVGLILGSLVALLLGRALESQLFGVASTDLLSILGALPVVVQVALLAALVPSLRASRVQPLVAIEGTE